MILHDDPARSECGPWLGVLGLPALGRNVRPAQLVVVAVDVHSSLAHTSMLRYERERGGSLLRGINALAGYGCFEQRLHVLDELFFSGHGFWTFRSWWTLRTEKHG